MTRLNSLAKRALLGVAPQTTTALLSARARAHSQRLVESWGLGRLNRRLIGEIGSTVASGPFRGLRLTSMTWREHVGPFLLGTYEMELHLWWDSLLTRPWVQVIDIGAKFGYYAVGLAVKFPNAEVVAFDTDRWARRVMKEMAAANRVENLSIKGYCTPQWLDRHIRPGALILSDCEGYEDALFQQVTLEALAKATVIIEAHEALVPGVVSRIESRLGSTHTVTRVASRDATDLPRDVRITSLDEKEIRAVSSEVRPPQLWLLLTPKTA
jgi:precorrin-6B methylase 2